MRLKADKIGAASPNFSKSVRAVRTVDEMPSHTHQQYVTANPGEGIFNTRMDYNSDNKNLNTYPQVQTGSTGKNKSHNNTPLSIAAYGWKRTA